MSRIFSITPPAGHKPMSVGETLATGPAGLRPYRVDEEDIDVLLLMPLAEVAVISGIDPYSSRGFELSFEEGAYLVRVFTPTSPNDWRIALDFLAGLSRTLGAPITEEQTYTPDTITSFPYQDDLRYGLEMMRSIVAKNPGKPIRIGGIRRPVSLTPEMTDRIFSAASPADEFGETMRTIQQVEAYDARSILARSPGGEIIGMYTLAEATRTVLPLKPKVSDDLREKIGDSATVKWGLTLIGRSGPVDQSSSYSTLGETSYDAALSRLPEDKVIVLDGESLVVDGLARKELLTLLGQ